MIMVLGLSTDEKIKKLLNRSEADLRNTLYKVRDKDLDDVHNKLSTIIAAEFAAEKSRRGWHGESQRHSEAAKQRQATLVYVANLEKKMEMREIKASDQSEKEVEEDAKRFIQEKEKKKLLPIAEITVNKYLKKISEKI